SRRQAPRLGVEREPASVERLGLAIEADEDQAFERPLRKENPMRLVDGNGTSALAREAVNPGRNGGKGDRAEAVRDRERQARSIAAGQQLILAGLAAMPHRPDRVNDVPRRQTV